MQYINEIKTFWKTSNARMIGNLNKVEFSNYRDFCLENENQSHRFMQIFEHIKRCKLESFNKIRFREGQLYFIATIFDKKKKLNVPSTLAIFFYFLNNHMWKTKKKVII